MKYITLLMESPDLDWRARSLPGLRRPAGPAFAGVGTQTIRIGSRSSIDNSINGGIFFCFFYNLSSMF